MTNLFSVAAFFIVLREVLEACLVVGIVLAYLRKTGATHMRRWVWIGAAAGVGLSLVCGITFAVLYYTRGQRLFSGKAEKIFEGIAFLIAAGLLTWMIIWMSAIGKKMQTNLEDRMEHIIENDDVKSKLGLATMVFVQVLREGIETFIFLFGAASATDDKNGWRGIPIPGILAVIVGLAASYLLFRGLVELDIQKFFLYSSVILIMFSAGLVSHAFHELQEADWFGKWKEPKDWYNATMWATTKCCNDKTNQFFAFLRALFGYQDKPTFIEWGTYFLYWILIIGVLLALNWQYVRAARSRIARGAKQLTALSLCVSFVAFIYVLVNVTWNGVLTMTLAFLISVVSTLVVFDAIAGRVGAIARSRRLLALASGVSLACLTAFIATLHIVQMACDEKGNGCSMPRFYYVGLIFKENWAAQGRAADGKSWVSLGVLSWSLAICVFFWGAMAFHLIVFAGNVDEEGVYRYDVESVKMHDDTAAADADADAQEVTADSLENMAVPA